MTTFFVNADDLSPATTAMLVSMGQLDQPPPSTTISADGSTTTTDTTETTIRGETV